MNNFRTSILKVMKSQRQSIQGALADFSYAILKGIDRDQTIRGANLKLKQIVIVSRLKSEKGIQKKMARFGEAREKVLDIIGHRIIVPKPEDLDKVAKILVSFSHEPNKDEMLLRNGSLQFPWHRDYRNRTHKGKSDLTSSDYNEAIHMNRKIRGKICEIQIVTLDLYRNAFLNRSGNVSHAQFARRRSQNFSK